MRLHHDFRTFASPKIAASTAFAALAGAGVAAAGVAGLSMRNGARELSNRPEGKAGAAQMIFPCR
jgi:hypothetical protein